jgi:hypothetical protein
VSASSFSYNYRCPNQCPLPVKGEVNIKARLRNTSQVDKVDLIRGVIYVQLQPVLLCSNIQLQLEESIDENNGALANRGGAARGAMEGEPGDGPTQEMPLY